MSSPSRRTCNHDLLTLHRNSLLCGFFTFPAEVRNRIYEYTLIEEEEINIEDWTPSILLACKQMRNEGIGIHLSRNKFVAWVYRGDYDHLADWLVCMSAVPLAHLQRITIDCFWGNVKEYIEEVRPVFYTEFKIWHEFVDMLNKFRLRGSQLKWPALPSFNNKATELFSEVENRHFFYQFVLTPLLACTFLTDDINTPPNIHSALITQKVDVIKQTTGKEEAKTLIKLTQMILMIVRRQVKSIKPRNLGFESAEEKYYRALLQEGGWLKQYTKRTYETNIRGKGSAGYAIASYSTQSWYFVDNAVERHRADLRAAREAVHKPSPIAGKRTKARQNGQAMNVGSDEPSLDVATLLTWGDPTNPWFNLSNDRSPQYDCIRKVWLPRNQSLCYPISAFPQTHHDSHNSKVGLKPSPFAFIQLNRTDAKPFVKSFSTVAARAVSAKRRAQETQVRNLVSDSTSEPSSKKHKLQGAQDFQACESDGVVFEGIVQSMFAGFNTTPALDDQAPLAHPTSSTQQLAANKLSCVDE